ncbi:MAG: hypothetical protein ACE5JS_21180, partial [Nitrospinota bacterium]
MDEAVNESVNTSFWGGEGQRVTDARGRLHVVVCGQASISYNQRPLAALAAKVVVCGQASISYNTFPAT